MAGEFGERLLQPLALTYAMLQAIIRVFRKVANVVG